MSWWNVIHVGHAEAPSWDAKKKRTAEGVVFPYYIILLLFFPKSITSIFVQVLQKPLFFGISVYLKTLKIW